MVIHPDFNSFTFANDIAILVLSEPVLDVEPSLIFRDEPLVGDLLLIVGYGGTGTAQEGSDGSFGTKRVGQTTIDEVTPQLVNWVYDDPSQANTASGDSGGPGYLDIEGDLFIACITSGGTEPDSVLGDFALQHPHRCLRRLDRSDDCRHRRSGQRRWSLAADRYAR